jgi:hypothetical protein
VLIAPLLAIGIDATLLYGNAASKRAIGFGAMVLYGDEVPIWAIELGRMAPPVALCHCEAARAAAVRMRARILWLSRGAVRN